MSRRESIDWIGKTLVRLGEQLIRQEGAQILISPQASSEGYWFGGGNLVKTNEGYLLCGRYRNAGDSRTGVAAGERGLEFAIFQSGDWKGPWEKVRSFSKADLSEKPVVSIEGGRLLASKQGLELFVSTEKDQKYPKPIQSYQKSGTGVWEIDRFAADSVSTLDPKTKVTVASSNEPSILHMKDPVPTQFPNGTALLFCTHPYTWSSSNSSYVFRENGSDQFGDVQPPILSRGPVWDVAATRITERLSIPPLGKFKDFPTLSLYFYDGAECLRSLSENQQAVQRPRGYSCEELGGLAWGFDEEFPKLERLTIDAPGFVSPWGTGCSRYVSTLITESELIATWQQSQKDLSQPLVGNALSLGEVEKLFS